jgi:hypothetical protein
MGHKVERNSRRTSKAARRTSPLLWVAIGFILLSLLLIASLVFLRSDAPRTLSGFDVFPKCRDALDVFISLQPDPRSLDVHVGITIRRRDTLSIDQAAADIHFPGFTTGHQFLMNASETYPISQRIPVPREMVEHDFNLGEDILHLRPTILGDRDITVEFLWQHGLARTGFADYSLRLPIGAIIQGNTAGIAPLDSFSASVVIPSGLDYRIVSSTLPGIRMVGDFTFLYFSACNRRLPLTITMQNLSRAQLREFLLVVIGCALGIAGTVTVEFLRRKGNA